MTEYNKAIIEFRLKDGFVIPESNKKIFEELFNGMALLFAQALEDKQQIPTTYSVTLK